MVNVYIRRRKRILFFYARRRRGFCEQEPSPLLSSNRISSLEEEVQNNGVLSSVSDLVDIGLCEGLPAPCISEKCQENSEVDFEGDATVAKGELLDDIFLRTEGSLHEDVATTANVPIGIGLINNEPLMSVIQQLRSTVCFQRKPRSARKSTSFDSRKWLYGLINNESRSSVVDQVPSTVCFQSRPRSARKTKSLASRRQSLIESSASDDSELVDSRLGASASVCCEFNPKTPIKEDRVSKFTSQSPHCDVKGLLSTGILEGALVKYKKDNLELQGILSSSGICCGCSLCNFEEVVSSLKFEKHAGSTSHNQNDHIFLENGKSLYALSKELKNVSLESLGVVMEEKFGYRANEAIYTAWKGGNSEMHHNNGRRRNQKHFPDLLHDNQASLNFPKGPRSTRIVRRPPSLISKVNQVSRQLIFCDVDLHQCPAHKKRGVDIESSKELYLKESSENTSAAPYQSKIGDISQKQKLPHILICKNNTKLSCSYAPDRPLSTISCLLERLLAYYKKDKIELLRCIKDIGIGCGFSSRRLNQVISSLNFNKYGGTSSMNPNDSIFVNKLACYVLVKEFGKVPLGLLPGEMIQKMIGCQPNKIRFLAWKESFHKNKINLQSTGCDDFKNQPAHILLDSRPPGDRLILPASENNSPLPPGNNVKVKFSRQTEKTRKHREQDFHQQIFELLNDGTKLSYYSHGKEILEGYKFGKNVLCSCCNSMLSASKFEAHAGHEKRRKPYHSIYTSYGKSLHEIAIYLLPDKNSFVPINKDPITMEKAGGKLAFTSRYQNGYNAGEQSSSTCSPFGFRFGRIFQDPCNLGGCMFCSDGDATLNFGNICDNTMLFCGQCGGMFHVGCLRIHGIYDIKARPNPPDTWLCGDKCIKVRAGLLNFVQEGPRTIPESLSASLRSSIRSPLHEETQVDVHWQLLSGRFQGDKSRLLLKQATKIFQEAFGAVFKGYRDVLSTMVNGEKGVAEFFGGMFCAVVTVKSIIVSAALLRVFGNNVAELPLAATIKKRRGEGFFKVLFLKIEEMLSFMKVEKLILPADDYSLPMWLEKFGFINLSAEEIREYQMKHRILVFENVTMLQKAVPSTLDKESA